jgi:hypothetical protein
VFRNSKDAPPAHPEGSQWQAKRSLWLQSTQIRALSVEPQILGASPMRWMFGLPVQTFHIWLPSFRRSTANPNF